MMSRYTKDRRHGAGLLFTGAVLGAGTIAGSGLPAAAAPAAPANISASFDSGVLTVVGDPLSNTIVISRDAAGNLRVNAGAVPNAAALAR